MAQFKQDPKIICHNMKNIFSVIRSHGGPREEEGLFHSYSVSWNYCNKKKSILFHAAGTLSSTTYIQSLSFCFAADFILRRLEKWLNEPVRSHHPRGIWRSGVCWCWNGGQRWADRKPSSPHTDLREMQRERESWQHTVQCRFFSSSSSGETSSYLPASCGRSLL